MATGTLCPYGAELVSCDVSSVTFRFYLRKLECLQSLEDALCAVQSLEVGTWSSSWSSMPNFTWRLDPLKRDQALTVDRAPTDYSAGTVDLPCTGTITALTCETEYTLRLMTRGLPDEPFGQSDAFVCCTAYRPKVDSVALSCVSRRSHSLGLAWFLLDPPGARVLECEIQYRLDGVLSSWQRVDTDFTPSALVEPDNAESSGGEPCRDGREWRVNLVGLQGATTYRARARARNEVGWSASYSVELECRTSEVPVAPYDLILQAVRKDCAKVSFSVEDPVGALVETCRVEVQTLLGFSKHARTSFDFANEVGSSTSKRSACCVLDSLEPETDYVIRLWASNASGLSRQPSETLHFRTAQRPNKPQSLCISIGPRDIEVEFEVEDPDGAPVLATEIEYCRDALFSSWVTASGVAIDPLAPETLESVLACCALPGFGASSSSAASLPNRVRRWKVRLGGLDHETGYLLCARAFNCVAWSLYTETVTARTSNLPPAPHGLRCVARMPTAVRLEFFVAELLGTAPVINVRVELSTSFSWRELRGADILNINKVSGQDFSQWTVTVSLGRTPGVVHKLRAWASNSFGQSKEPSATCDCQTSDKPKPLTDVWCVARMPHSLTLEWSVDDPEGAPVRRFEAQTRVETAFAGWQPALCDDAIRIYADDNGSPANVWRCILEKLEPETSYTISVRSWNEAGWAEWQTFGTIFRTSSSPARPLSVQSHRTTSGKEVSGAIALCMSLDVDVLVEDPEGAPIMACMVLAPELSGSWTLARRRASNDQRGHWRAQMECVAAELAVVSIQVRLANAVGWSNCAVTCTCQAPQGTEVVHNACDFTVTSLDLVVSEVKRALSDCVATKVRLESLLADAVAYHDEALESMLVQRNVEVDARMLVLHEAASTLGQPLSSTLASTQELGKALVAELQNAGERKVLLPDSMTAAKVLSLLLRAYLWLEHSWRPALLCLCEDIKDSSAAVSTSGGAVLHQWVQQHQAWSSSFERKVSDALPEGVASTAQLLAVLACGRSRLELFKTVASDLNRCLTLVAAAERQLKRLGRSHRILYAAEKLSYNDFSQQGVLEKIETTALGLLTMLVLPVPGSIEVGTVGLGMLWLEGNQNASSHIALEHPPGVPLGPMLERWGSCPPPRARIIIAGWACGGHKGVVLVHNATVRRITVTIKPDNMSVASKAFSKLQAAHPMVKVVGSALSESTSGENEITISPTDVALLQMPEGGGPNDVPILLEFAYGPPGHIERPIGHSRVRLGTAVSFMHLESMLQVCNVEEGENAQTVEGAVIVFNDDLSPVSLSVYRPIEARARFESSLLSEELQSGELKQVTLPQPCAGRIFHFEFIFVGGKKACCEVRPGQRIIIDGSC